MSEQAERIRTFLAYASSLSGDEKGEAQVFCDRLFQAFGHKGYKEAGAILEERVKRKGRGTAFADLLWRPRLLLEMKSRGEKLQRHYQQAFDYWLNATPNRPRYVVLCNFDEFWIYDYNAQLHEPVDRVRLEELPDRYTAFNFLFPEDRKPLFNNDRVAVTREAADKVAQVFNAMIARGEDRERAQRFVLQCVVAMFSEDFELLPRGLFSELLNDCQTGANSYDLIGSLFHQMNSQRPARGGRFQRVAYFNGGLFETIEPIDLRPDEVKLLQDAATENWSKVAPPIFGTLFQSSMDAEQRHALGAHFTSEADIQKVVRPTIVRPWRDRIRQTDTLKGLLELSEELLNVRVLDPACGSGNFLYIAYRELVNLEMEILAKIHENFGRRARRSVGTASLVSTTQFYGIDKDAFAVELAKVTLMLGKRLALAEIEEAWLLREDELPFEFEKPLPLDNLDDRIVCDDALFCDWPDADYIIGNPPYQSKNKMQEEFGRAYLNELRDKFPDVPGRADFCVYWFRKTHDRLNRDGRAGLVGTNTIRQTYSRQGGLDYIVNNGGTITEAVSSQVWSGDAVVHVSIVNWIKGKAKGEKQLFTQVGDDRDSPWQVERLALIPSSLSADFDISQAKALEVNAQSRACYQGQTHGHEGFLLSVQEAREWIQAEPENAEVLYPYLTADELFSTTPPGPQRFVIDFHPRSMPDAARYSRAFEHVQSNVLPTRVEAARREKRRNKVATAKNPNARVNRHHANFLQKWWQLSYAREEMIQEISRLPRYIVCGQVTRRPIFEFVSSAIRPNAALIVFPLVDDYSFGILQSVFHWKWFVGRCSTLKADFRYTSNTVFDSFAWPQTATISKVRAVAKAAVALRKARRSLMQQNEWSLREVYRSLELPGKHPIKTAQSELDEAVCAAYGFRKNANPLEALLNLNLEVAEAEARGEEIVAPGMPESVKAPNTLITDDAVQPLI